MRRRLLRRIASITLTAAFSLALVPPASGMFMRAPEVPVERLIQNIHAYLHENPDDAEAHFLAARVNYIAFANKSLTIRSNSEGTAEELPNVTDPKLQWIPEQQQTLDEDALVVHARAAITHFMRAIALDEDNALYRLGLAGILEQSADYADLIGPLEDLTPIAEDEDAEENKHKRSAEDRDADANPGNEGDEDTADPPLYDTFIDRSIEENLWAYELGRDEALAINHMMHPFFPIAYEAGKAYLRLFEEHRIETPDEDRAQQIRDLVAAVDSKPQMITPIIFRVQGEAPTCLDDLLAPNLEVDFDMDGDGTAERRPWVNPDTAILVWDPEHKGEITSGQQLFGNMTFFMLFADGYQALGSLDNNRDGQLTGDELIGLALWHDQNSNGISEPGEVTPLDETHITAIATTSTDHDDIHPRNLAGLELSDGETRPTWDWIATEIMVESP